MDSKKVLPSILMVFSLAIFAAPGIGVRAQSATPVAGPSVISLDGDWHFLADAGGSLKLQDLANAPGVRPLRVPSSWQIQFDDLRDYSGVAWYWRTFEVPAIESGRIALLHFGAVDYQAQVFVNTQNAGSHEGGYLPFDLDVTSLLHPGLNEVAVRVVDPGPKHPVQGIHYDEIQHGKQNWYVENSGLWQSVVLRILPRTHWGVVHVTAGMDGGFSIHAQVEGLPASGEPSGEVSITAEIIGPEGKPVWQGVRALDSSRGVAMFSGTVQNAELWSPDHPALYTVHLQLSTGDSETYPFGFRTFATHDGKFYLNGKPIYLRGALDQAFYPETGYVPPSLDYLIAQMKKAKAIGLNLLRCHIKLPDPRYLEAADETGILVWYEIPNWDKLTAYSDSQALETLRGMARRDWNHPSIIQVSIINESWGANLKEAADRAWLKDAYQQAKKSVPWLVDDNSPCCDNFHLQTDVADFHDYNAIPDHAADFDRLVSDLATRPGWLFSPYGDAAPKGTEPLMLSEFGNWGLPVVPEQKPWWFGREFGGQRVTIPEGVEKRFEDYDYNTLFSNLRDLSQATQWHEFQALRYEIGSLRMHSEIQGYVITEFDDTQWESNGLYDFWRNSKVFARNLAALQQDDALILRADNRNLYPGSAAEFTIYISHYGSADLAKATVHWQVQGTTIQGNLPLPAVPVGSVARVGEIKFTVPMVPAPQERVLDAQIIVNGRPLAGNSLDLFFYPREKPELPPPVSFHDPAGELRRLVTEMRERGYQEPYGQEAFPVLIASAFDAPTKQALDSGARVILLPAGPEDLGAGVKAVPRTGNLSGNWISDFPWVRNQTAPFAGIGFGAIEGFESKAITPGAVVRGIPAQDFSDVLAGLFFGWLHDNVGTLVQARYGKGKLLICTFSLAASYGTDPYATTFLDSLVRYAASDFEPRWQLAP